MLVKDILSLDKNIRPVEELKAEEKEKRKQYYNAFKKKNPNYYKEKRAKEKLENYEKALYYQAMSTAKRMGIKFKLKIEDIVIPNNCPITELKIVKVSGKDWANPYVFLIKKELGYVKENILITCVLANHLRNCGTAQIIAYCKNINSLT